MFTKHGAQPEGTNAGALNEQRRERERERIIARQEIERESQSEE